MGTVPRQRWHRHRQTDRPQRPDPQQLLDPLLLLDRPQPLDPLQLLDRHQRLDVQLLLLGRPQWLDPLLLLGPQVCRLLRRIPGYALLPQSAPVLLWSCSGYLSCGPPTGAAPDKPPDPGRPFSAGLSSEQCRVAPWVGAITGRSTSQSVPGLVNPISPGALQAIGTSR
ncbi:hypothetical protein BN381_130236 [Candidatus Microthrix parvicella RN1]|uniref:Uncharacterized protein n=1 Tax=Candidatus Neomicrothrix parvicella RN1 TaxID=1229780 RepID=R4YX19_9ACTN|nr:hypothetical protein BN381_130236 [Candidatus Microthrix parvicella RN1]